MIAPRPHASRHTFLRHHAAIRCAAAGLCLLCAAAAAAGPAPDLMSLDADGDRAVSRDELVAALKPRFARIDQDGNGKVAMSELRAFAIGRMTGGEDDPVLAHGRGRPDLPFDRHGEVDFAGFSQAIVRFRFDPLDRDRDRTLSVAEIAADRAR